MVSSVIVKICVIRFEFVFSAGKDSDIDEFLNIDVNPVIELDCREHSATDGGLEPVALVFQSELLDYLK